MENNNKTSGSQSASDLINLIDSRSKKVFNSASESFVKVKIGVVLSYDSNNGSAVVNFPEDGDNSQFSYYNKTSEALSEGDNVKIYYTTNPAKGWIGARCGEPSVKEITIYGGEGVGRPSPWDVTSEYFNYYDEKNHNVAGDSTLTGSLYATARGYHTQATGYYSSAEGSYTKATYSCTHAEGNGTEASGYCGHAEGLSTKANGQRSHAEGTSTTASGSNSHAEGERTSATGESSHAEGYGTQATAYASSATGQFTKATFSFAHAEGNGTEASGQSSHAEGASTKASGSSSHAEGQGCVASEPMSHAEGGYTKATGTESHAEGYGSESSGYFSHAEGNTTVASGMGSHSEGSNTNATGQNSHAEGSNCTSEGDTSHAGGKSCTASLPQSFAHGNGLKMPEDGKSGTAVFGQYNDYSDKNIIFSIGNGSNDNNRSNAFSVDNDGNIYCKSIIQTGTTTATALSDDGSGSLTYTAVSENVIEYGKVTYTFITADTGEYTGVTTSTGKSMTANIPAGLGNVQTHNAAFIALAMMSLK